MTSTKQLSYNTTHIFALIQNALEFGGSDHHDEQTLIVDMLYINPLLPGEGIDYKQVLKLESNSNFQQRGSVWLNEQQSGDIG